MESTTLIGSMPSAIPTNKETIIKVIKAFSLNLAMRMNRRRIPRITINKGIFRIELV